MASPVTAERGGAAPVMTDYSYTGGKMTHHPLAPGQRRGQGRGVHRRRRRRKAKHPHRLRGTARSTPSPCRCPTRAPPSSWPAPPTDYATGTSPATVSVDGLSGTNRSVAFDALGRTTSETQTTGAATPSLTTAMVWDGADNLVAVTDPAGRRTVTTYDGDAMRAHASGRPTESFGPAPVSACYSGYTPTCTTTMPHARDRLRHRHRSAGDHRLGGPGRHLLGQPHPGRRPSPARPGRAQGPQAWPHLVAGSPLAALPPGLAANDWSARYTGELTVTMPAPTASPCRSPAAASSSSTTCWSSTPPATGPPGGVAPPSASLGVGRHRIRLDYEAPTTGTAALVLSWTPPVGSAGAVPAGSVAPRYSLATSSTVDDLPTAATQVSATTYGSIVSPGIAVATGLVTSSISGTGATALDSRTDYVDSAGMLRPSASYQPGAATSSSAGTDYTWWTPSATSAGCAGSDNVKQAGALASVTEPDQGGGARRTESYAYDWAGRTVEEHHWQRLRLLHLRRPGPGAHRRLSRPTSTPTSPNVTEPARTRHLRLRGGCAVGHRGHRQRRRPSRLQRHRPRRHHHHHRRPAGPGRVLQRRVGPDHHLRL